MRGLMEASFMLALVSILTCFSVADGISQQYCYQVCGCSAGRNSMYQSAGGSRFGMGGGGWQPGNYYGGSGAGYGSGWKPTNYFGSGGGGGFHPSNSFGNSFGGGWGGSSGSGFGSDSFPVQNWSPNSASNFNRPPKKLIPILVDPIKKLKPKDGFILPGKLKKHLGTSYASAGGKGGGNRPSINPPGVNYTEFKAKPVNIPTSSPQLKPKPKKQSTATSPPPVAISDFDAAE